MKDFSSDSQGTSASALSFFFLREASALVVCLAVVGERGGVSRFVVVDCVVI